MNKKFAILWLMQVGTCICLKCDYEEESVNLYGPRKLIFGAICYNLTSMASLGSELNATRIEKLTIGAHSAVDVLPADSAISGCIHLRILILRFLGIEKITPGAFGGLNKLETLDLSYNQLREIPVGVFNDLINLVNLSLFENQITKISSGLFANLRKLMYLDLSVNLISDIGKGCLSDLISLKGLNLGENNITVLHENLFQNLTKLEMLVISKNPITRLQTVVIPGRFYRLYATNTLLKNFNVSFSNYRIDRLDLSGSRLEEFDFAVLDSAFQYLTLSNNRLRTLKNISTVKASTIDLSNNNITELDKISSRIKILKLSHNNIRNLKFMPQSSDDPYGLWELDVSFNQIETALCFGFINLAHLFLQNNHIIVIKENSFADCPNLRDINLSFNKIKSFESNAFKGLSELKFLYVSSNNLEQLNSDSFSGLVNLETLFFDNNRIASFDIKDIVKNTPKLHSITMKHNSFICEHLDTTLKSMRLCHVVPIDVNYVGYDECKEPQAS